MGKGSLQEQGGRWERGVCKNRTGGGRWERGVCNNRTSGDGWEEVSKNRTGGGGWERGESATTEQLGCKGESAATGDCNNRRGVCNTSRGMERGSCNNRLGGEVISNNRRRLQQQEEGVE